MSAPNEGRLCQVSLVQHFSDAANACWAADLHSCALSCKRRTSRCRMRWKFQQIFQGAPIAEFGRPLPDCRSMQPLRSETHARRELTCTYWLLQI